MFYIDEQGRLIYDCSGLKSEITGVNDTGIFSFEILWEK